MGPKPGVATPSGVHEALFVGSQTVVKTNLKNAVFYILRQSVVYSNSTALGVRFVVIPIALAYNALYFREDYLREKNSPGRLFVLNIFRESYFRG